MVTIARMEEYLSNVQIEDIPLESRWIAEELGMDAIKTLCRLAGGSTLYIPKIESIYLNARNRMIRAEFDGGNIRGLAIRHGLTPRYIRTLLQEADKPSK